MRIIESCSQETQEAATRCLDTFGGADGGVSFVKFCQFLIAVEKQAAEGNPHAQDLVRLVHQFGRLLKHL